MRLPLFILLSISLFLSSCAVSSKVSTTETYKADYFSPAAINSEGLAILPITAGADLEGYRRPFGDVLNQSMDGLFENITGWNQTMQRLNTSGLVADYQSAIQAYNETAILDQSVMQKMTKALGVRYLLYVRLSPPESSSRTRYSALAGTTYNEQSQAVMAYAKIWDQNGDVVWEGSSKTTAVSGAYSYIEDSIADQCKKTAQGLAKRIRGIPSTNP